MEKEDNICLGCGLVKENANHEYCVKCFQAINYGKIKNNLIDFNFEDLVKENIQSDFYLVTDFLNFRNTLIKNINKFVSGKKLTIIVNKIDVVPKSVAFSKIMDWVLKILKEEKIEFSNIILLSSLKNYGIDLLNKDILEKNIDISFVGYSNVGKSTIVKQLAKVNNFEAKNVVSHTIGTTLGIIKNKLENGKYLIDYPGLYSEINSQNVLSYEQLKLFLPKSEIRSRNFNFTNEGFYSINDFVYIKVKTNKRSSLQAWFSNNLKMEFRNYENFLSKEMTNKSNFNRSVIINENYNQSKMLIIIGLGFIFLPKEFDEVEIYSKQNFFTIIENSIFKQ